MTTDDRTAAEVLRDAIAMEAEGMEFFDRASGMMKRDRSRDMFLGLVAQEKRHIGVLDHQLHLLQEGRGWAPLEDAKRDSASAGPSVFGSEAAGKLEVDPDAGELEVIDIGIGVEERSIEYYKAAGTSSPDENAKQVFRWLVEEESGHLMILRAERDSRSGSGFYYDEMEFTLEKE